jgi:hypothetical protein
MMFWLVVIAAICLTPSPAAEEPAETIARSFRYPAERLRVKDLIATKGLPSDVDPRMKAVYSIDSSDNTFHHVGLKVAE